MLYALATTCEGEEPSTVICLQLACILLYLLLTAPGPAADAVRHAWPHAGGAMLSTMKVPERDPWVASLRVFGPLVALLLLSLTGCREEAPTVVSRGEPIAVGALTMKVSQVEMLSASSLPGVSQAPPGMSFLVLVLRLEGDLSENGSRFVSPLDKVVLDLMTRLAVEDGEGQRYTHPAPLPFQQYRMIRSAGLGTMPSASTGATRLPGDWATLFTVPSDSRDFRLLVRNPRGDQPRTVAVVLGR
jgi:hypothetical protein